MIFTFIYHTGIAYGLMYSAMKKMSALNDGSLNEEELKYYLQVTNRINEKLLDAAL